MNAWRVAFDLTQAQIAPVGISVYSRSLFQALQPLLPERLAGIASRLARPAPGATRTWGQRAATLARDLWWHQAGAVVAARRRGCALLHVPGSVGPMRTGFPVVATIHDVMPLRFPEMFRPWFRSYARVVIPRLARTARAVITGSAAAKAEIVEHLGVPAGRVVVIPYGVDTRFTALTPGDAGAGAAADAARRRYGLPDAYVLAVGSVEPRKNLPRLLRAVRLLRDRPDTRHVALVHSGPGGYRPEDVARAARELGLDGAAQFLGYVPTEDLRLLYAGARALVYPSLWEGFGLPVLEAMACGCPVITSAVSSLPEVAGAAAILVDPESVEDIAAAITRIWPDTPLRADLVRRGLEHARSFTWEAAARATVAVYEAALG